MLGTFKKQKRLANPLYRGVIRVRNFSCSAHILKIGRNMPLHYLMWENVEPALLRNYLLRSMIPPQSQVLCRALPPYIYPRTHMFSLHGHLPWPCTTRSTTNSGEG